jgi:hypothetical protein
MKKISSLLFFLPLLTTGQLRIINPRLFNPDSAYLYIGVPNTLKITGAGKGSSMQLKGDGVTIQKGYVENEFTVLAPSAGTSTIKIYKNGKCIHTKIYQVSRIPDPVVSLGKNTSRLLTVTEILADPSLYLVLPGCHLDARFSIISFSALFIRTGTDNVMSEASDGNRMSAGQLNVVKTLVPGDKIIFDDIKVQGPDSRTRTVPAVTIVIR